MLTTFIWRCAYHTSPVSVVEPSVPAVDAGRDTAVGLNDMINLHGSVTDSGIVVEYAWKIGSGDWIVTSTGDTTIIAPLTAQVFVCSLRVISDSGGIGFDAITITVDDALPWIPEGKLEYSNGMVKVVANGHNFWMGSSKGLSDEEPMHIVKFTYDFWMDTTEVTQADYNTLMAATYAAYSTPPWSGGYGVGDNYPAYFVNWYDALLYCNARSKRDGLEIVYSYTSISGTPGNDCVLGGVSIDLLKNGYRLPTEAEWEYACRAGTTTDYYWGDIFNNSINDSMNDLINDSIVKHYAWFVKNADSLIWTDPHAGTLGSQPVGARLPNAYGLYDMSGNVWEWCNDWYGIDYYTSYTQTDPTGSKSGIVRSIRGGCWISSSSSLRSANRNSYLPDYEIYHNGFRVVLPLRQ